MNDPAIDVEHLRKSYSRGLLRKRKHVLEDVSFRVRRGAVFGFLGPNGAGKSTTIKILLNFVRADGGKVHVLGAPPTNASIRRRIGFLPETADYYPFLTPHRLLLLYCDMLGLHRSEARPMTERLLDLVGLSSRKDEQIGIFSKGMKQRVGIAQALLNDPELLILDEPASGLDPLGQHEIRNLILDQKKAGKTIFFSSHELSEVEAVCDEATIIRSGKTIRSGTLVDLVPFREEVLVRLRGIPAETLAGRPFVHHMEMPASPDEVAFVAEPGVSVEALAHEVTSLGAEIVSVSAVRDSLEDTFLRLMGESE